MKNKIRNIPLILLGTVLLGLVLRLLFFSQISFGYDQARDALESISIFARDPFKIIGPGTDILYVNHGTLYWYLISPFYYFSSGNVYLVKLVHILFNLVNIFFIYYFSYKLFKNRKVSLISAFFMAVSFEAVQYGRWLSNPAPAFFFVSLVFYGIWLLLKGEGKGLPIVLIAYAFSVQFQLFLGYLLVFIALAIFYFLFKKGFLTKTHIFLSLLSLLVVSTYLLSEIKFGFRITKTLFAYLIRTDNSSFSKLLTLPQRFGEKLVFNTFYNLWGLSFTLATIFIFLLFFWITWSVAAKRKFFKEKLFLTFWFVSPLTIYLVNPDNWYFLNIGNSYALLMLTALLIYEMVQKLKTQKLVLVLILAFIFLNNLNLILKYNWQGETLFNPQEEMTLKNEIALIDWIYRESQGQPFRINTVTNPLFYNTTWAFLFDNFGRKKYGYMPDWGGYPQEGEDAYGKEVKFAKYDDGTKLLYLIIEPDSILPANYVYAFKKFEEQRSKILTTRKFGKHMVQKRGITKIKYFSREEVNQFALEYK